MKTCPICHTMFLPAVPHQEYDRLNCRKRAERQRARLRDKGVGITRKQHYGAADHATMMNPTTGVLDEMAQVYLNNPSALTTIFSGAIPEWTPPMGVGFIKQLDDTGDWAMTGMTPMQVAMAEHLAQLARDSQKPNEIQEQVP
jgi:hypothetical protein